MSNRPSIDERLALREQERRRLHREAQERLKRREARR